MNKPTDLHSRVSTLKAEGQPFALATVVRTVATTAAKAGAKAIIHTDGTITEGWIGGGCARAAVLNAAKEALKTGTPKLISIQPEDLLDAAGTKAGEVRDGVHFARNMCPSQGTMDIFVEPILPEPELQIHGQSPVAQALTDLGRRIGFAITEEASSASERFIVIATQGKGDEAALRAALATDAPYIAFVGSRKKATALKTKLGKDFGENTLARLQAPAGLHLGAITPEEIALSILAEITSFRRKGQRDQ